MVHVWVQIFCQMISTLFRKEETAISPSMLVWLLCFLSLLIYLISHVYIYYVCVYSCMLAYQEFVLTLATGWTWGQRATALSYSSGYWIQQPLTFSLLMLSKTLFYTTFSPTTSFLTAVKNGGYGKPYVWFQLFFYCVHHQGF